MGLRRWILVIFVVAVLGVGVELLLIGHAADGWQLIPVVLLGLAVVVLVWLLARQDKSAVRAFRLVSALCVLSGFLGIALHCKAKMEYKREGDPSLSGFTLFWSSLDSAMPPAMAPGSMIQLGLVGIAFAHGHPALTRKEESS
jgi:hypothetical protein